MAHTIKIPCSIFPFTQSKKKLKYIVLDIGDTDVYKAVEDLAFMKYVFYGRVVP